MASRSEPSSLIKSMILMVCPKCKIYKTKNREDMKIHFFNEFNYYRYACPAPGCGHKFITDKSLKGHYTYDHRLLYDEKFSQQPLPIVQKIEDYVQNYFAEQDGLAKPSAELENFAEQEELAKPSVEVEKLGGRLICKHCSHPCNTYHTLKIHILAQHVASDRFKCSYCDRHFYLENLATNHIKRNHPDMPLVLTERVSLRKILTPEFWMKQYGIPNGTKKKAEKKFVVLPAASNETETDAIEYQLDYVKSDRVGNLTCPYPYCGFKTKKLSELHAHIKDCVNE